MIPTTVYGYDVEDDADSFIIQLNPINLNVQRQQVLYSFVPALIYLAIYQKPHFVGFIIFFNVGNWWILFARREILNEYSICRELVENLHNTLKWNREIFFSS